MTYKSTVLADTPFHWWRCNDPGGQILNDFNALTPRSLMVTGFAQQVGYSGPTTDGGSVWIDSNTGAWLLDSNTALPQPFSYECWVWRHRLSGNVEVLFSHGNQLVITAAGKIQFQGVANVFNVTGATTLTEQQWHHVVGTYGPTNGVKLYVDGAQDATAAYAGAIAGANPITLGVSSTSSNAATINAAEVAEYAYELTAAKVLAHFNAAEQPGNIPTFQLMGRGNLSSGTSDLNTATLDAILAAVQHTFPTTT